MPGAGGPRPQRAVSLLVIVAALGYFVDIYDLILFGVIRVDSLRSLGLSGAALTDRGVALLNWQMGGMLLGGILWGVLGDRRGRLSVLFGSIILYSLANIANGLVRDVPTYAFVRFLAGLGLAGELGAGITLVSETMHKEARGYGTAIVATVGICGAVVAALVADWFTWRTAYFVGGGLGLALLFLRLGVLESGMFQAIKGKTAVRRGDFFSLFSRWDRLRRYLSVILVGVPIWYVVAVLIILSPEIGTALGVHPAPAGKWAVLWCYVGLAVGDLGSGVLSQIARSRKKVIGGFLFATTILVAVYFEVRGMSRTNFYTLCVALGVSTGYWAVFVTVASEQFGTNLRATVTTTAPNFVRGAVVPLTKLVLFGKGALGIAGSAAVVGAGTLALAFLALLGLNETFGQDLDYVEPL